MELILIIIAIYRLFMQSQGAGIFGMGPERGMALIERLPGFGGVIAGEG